MNKLSIEEISSMENPIRMIIFTSRGLKKKFNEVIKEKGVNISFEEYLAISHLLVEDGVYQTDFCVKLDKDRAGASRIIDSLIKKEFAYKELDEKDNRKYKVYATEKSRNINLEKLENEIIQETLHGISEEKVKEMVKEMSKIVSNIKDLFPNVFTE